MRLLHIVAGLLGLVSGAVALSALKGAKLHNRSGLIFVYCMLFTSSSGALMAALQPRALTVMGGVLTFYLVATALLTVRSPVPEFRGIDAAALLLALGVGLSGITLGFEVLGSATGDTNGDPAAVYFTVGSVALLATLGDVRLMLGRRLQGPRRIARHLWRMCVALLFGTASFFLGRTQLFSQPLRDSGLLAIPVVLVLLVTFYWLARVLFPRRSLLPILAPGHSFRLEATR